MISRLTNGATTLCVRQADPTRDAWVSTTPAGSIRLVAARRVPGLLARYRRRGYVDPTELALHRARLSGEGRTLELGTAAKVLPTLTAALLRQLLAEVPGRNRAAAAALLGVSHDTVRRAIRALPALRAELDDDPSSRGGGWREGHASRRPPDKSTGSP